MGWLVEEPAEGWVPSGGCNWGYDGFPHSDRGYFPAASTDRAVRDRFARGGGAGLRVWRCDLARRYSLVSTRNLGGSPFLRRSLRTASCVRIAANARGVAAARQLG